jgi:hypothetical protein
MLVEHLDVAIELDVSRTHSPGSERAILSVFSSLV